MSAPANGTPRRALDLLITAASVAVIAWAAVILLRNRSQESSTPTQKDRMVDRSLVSNGGHALGPTDAKHVLVVFSDFECPFCKVYSTTIDSLATLHPEVRIVERHFPLTGIHAFALRAALGAECAGKEGRYWEMRKVLFERPLVLQSENWSGLATFAGVHDTAAFTECVKNEQLVDRVRDDMKAATTLALDRTPTIIVDGRLYARPPRLADLEKIFRN